MIQAPGKLYVNSHHSFYKKKFNERNEKYLVEKEADW